MKHFLCAAALLFCALTGFSQDKDIVTVKEISIEPYKSLSYQAFFKSLVLKSPDCAVEYIQGFEFEWGYHYRLKVQETKLANPLQDAGDTEYKLLEVISKEKVTADYEFQMRLERETRLDGDEDPGSLHLVNDTTYRYMDEVEFTFQPSQQDELAKIATSSMRVVGRFRFDEQGKLVLVRLH